MPFLPLNDAFASQGSEDASSKNHTIPMEGPFSFTRNPFYLA
jgi:protein-S-isoprenylcysteine O-methyltransferase Ste14